MTCFLYREINAEGKGNCRINGMPATAAVVRDISAGLLSIHGQHDSQSLTNPALHLGLLDQYAQNRELFAEYYRRYRELVTVKAPAGYRKRQRGRQAAPHRSPDRRDRCH